MIFMSPTVPAMHRQHPQHSDQNAFGLVLIKCACIPAFLG